MKALSTRQLVVLALTFAAIFAFTGCITTNDETPRSWNSPKSWETGGVPQGMMRGR